MSDLTHKIIRAVKWNLAGTLGNQLAQFLVGIILVRLLTPAEFGLVAMLNIFMSIAAVAVDSGYGSALIQKQDLAPIEESSVFFFNLGIAFILYILFWFLAVPIAVFYREPDLVPITRVLSFVFISNALGLVQNSLLSRQLDFKTLGKANILSTILSGIIGVVMAFRGCGVWSLVVYSVFNALSYSALLWVFSAWRPIWAFSRSSMRSMFSYGSKLFFSGLLWAIFDKLDLLFIGRMFSKTALGYYSRAQITQKLPTLSLSTIVSNVTFPAYSSIQDDRVRLREGYRKTIIAVSIVAFPIMFGLLAVSKPLFVVLFTEKWLPSVPYFRILCIVGSLYHLHTLNLNVMKASGRSDLFLLLEATKKFLIFMVLIITCRFGITAILWGQVAVSIISLFLNTYYTRAIINYGLRHQLADIWQFIALSAVAAGIAYFVDSRFIGLSNYIRVLLMMVVGGSIYCGIAYRLNIGGSVDMLKRILSHIRPEKVSVH